jgi:hypothetical protein
VYNLIIRHEKGRKLYSRKTTGENKEVNYNQASVPEDFPGPKYIEGI